MQTDCDNIFNDGSVNEIFEYVVTPDIRIKKMYTNKFEKEMESIKKQLQNDFINEIKIAINEISS